MLRTTIGVSFILVLGGLPACSSKSTDDHNSGGNGTIVGSGGSATGGTTSGSTGGTTGNGAGTSNSSAGKTATAGSSGTDLCVDDTVTCTDATHAMACNPATGVVETFSCEEDLAKLGFTSSGCSMDATGDGCDVTGVSDPTCQTGAAAYGFCNRATDDQVVNIYINCFQDNLDAHTIVPCFAKYVSTTMMTANDCLRAEENCLPGVGGTGTGGTGGTGTATAGTDAGGAP
jgi:hypothetical protein